MRRGDARREALEWIPRFGLRGFERSYPSALSGGMRQRAALLRTFLGGRDILLLDEPFGALDALTRADMQEWLLDIWQELGKTVIFVTHDVDEAIFLSDRAYVMSPRPGSIRSEVEITLARPRVYDATVTSTRFSALKREILREVRSGSSGEVSG
jgi:ABC-type nitrate/sulfonate/bicarbonate transport system ATPase subunit